MDKKRLLIYKVVNTRVSDDLLIIIILIITTISNHFNLINIHLFHDEDNLVALEQVSDHTYKLMMIMIIH